jgi:hypothetical protein
MILVRLGIHSVKARGLLKCVEASGESDADAGRDLFELV